MNLYEQLQEKLGGHSYQGYFSCNCVFHSDQSPSMFVYADGFHCKSCRKRGTLEYLNKYLGGRDVKIKKPAPTLLPQWRKWEDKYGDLNGIAKFAHENCIRYPQFQFYFKQRKIEQFFEKGYFGYIDGWCLFPVFNQEHKIENIVVRHTKNKGTRYAIKPLEEKKPLLYCPNWDRVKNSDTVHVCYGLLDSWAFEAVGKACVTGITGKSLSPELLKPLGKHFVIVPDEWEDGDARTLSNALGWRSVVKKLVYPENTKDPNDVCKLFGEQYFAELLGA